MVNSNPITSNIAMCAANSADLIISKGYVHLERDKVAVANVAVFTELHNWSLDHLPMGCSEAEYRKTITKGMQTVKANFKAHPDLARKYGCDPITILTVISALFNIISHIIAWLKAGKTE